MKTELLDPENARWHELLSCLPHDVYHQPGYVRAAIKQEGARGGALVVERDENTLLMPLLLRPVAGTDRLEATSPYGYPSPLLRASDPAFSEAAARAAANVLREMGVVSFFGRMHPLLDSALALARAHGVVVSHGETVWSDLTRSDQELWSETRSGHRNEINRLVRGGHVVTIAEDPGGLPEFVRIYEETMRRVDAAAYYLFPIGYYESLFEELRGRVHLARVHVGEKVAAAALFFETGGIVQYHLSGTAEEFLRLRPTKLLLHEVRKWARLRGNHSLHYGGGLGGRADSLFDFKAGFSPKRATYHTWRWVIDQPRYDELTRAVGGDPNDLTGLFPGFKRPPAKSVTEPEKPA